MNRDGKILVSGGVPETQAQPPCLLRYSPQLWAKELPTMFAHDPETNTLSLQPDRQPPWIRKTAEHDRASTRESTKTWLYCMLGGRRARLGQAPYVKAFGPEDPRGIDCKGRWCSDGDQRPRAFLPFRDRASQLNMRPHRPPQREEATSGNSQPQPKPEPEDADVPAESELVMPMGEDEDDTHPLPVQAAVPDPPPPAVHPTLDEYQARWAEKLEAHARPSQGPFSLVDLVPKKVPNLWQDCRDLSASPRA